MGTNDNAMPKIIDARKPRVFKLPLYSCDSLETHYDFANGCPSHGNGANMELISKTKIFASQPTRSRVTNRRTREQEIKLS